MESMGTHSRPCQNCKGDRLAEISECWDLVLKRVFPANSIESVYTRRVQLLFCQECVLVQPSCTFSLQEIHDYDYRYGCRLNTSMGPHLGRIFQRREVRVNPNSNLKMPTVSEERAFAKKPEYRLLFPLLDRAVISN
jgi:hypothetical protein